MAERRQVESAYLRIRRQAVKTLRQMRADIRTREQHLDQLRKQEQQISSLLGPVRDGAPERTRGGRINWRDVLKQLPKEFKASDVRKVRGLGGKQSSEIFSAITRWINTKAVKRKERGIYQRVG